MFEYQQQCKHLKGREKKPYTYTVRCLSPTDANCFEFVYTFFFSELIILFQMLFVFVAIPWNHYIMRKQQQQQRKSPFDNGKRFTAICIITCFSLIKSVFECLLSSIIKRRGNKSTRHFIRTMIFRLHAQRAMLQWQPSKNLRQLDEHVQQTRFAKKKKQNKNCLWLFRVRVVSRTHFTNVFVLSSVQCASILAGILQTCRK